MSKRCRTCGKIICCPSAKNIFQPESILLHHIKALSGLSLLDQHDFPSHICRPCEVSLREAIIFRELILRTQQLLLSSESVADTLQELDLETEKKLTLGEEDGKQIFNSYNEITHTPQSKLSRKRRKENIEADDSIPSYYIIKVEEPVIESSSDGESLQVKAIRQRVKNNIKAENSVHKSTSEYSYSEENQNIHDPLENLSEERKELALVKDAANLSEIKNDDPDTLISSNATFMHDEPIDDPFLYMSSDSEEYQSEAGVRKTPVKQKVSAEPKVKLKRGPQRNPRPKLSKEELKNRARKYRIQDLICEICAKPFQCRSNLRQHLQWHTGVKKYSCDQCPKKFHFATLLRRHMYIHVKDKPYKCRYCENSYTNPNARTQHERLRHTNYKPFKCTECDKSFVANNKLKTHMICHTGVRNFHCNICEMSFLSKNNLRTHYRSKSHKKKAQMNAETIDIEIS